MKTLIFEGCSDDTFGEYALTSDDYDNCASGKPIRYRVSANGESMIVFGRYCPDGSDGWVIGVGRDAEVDDDDKPMPRWAMRIEIGEREYSPRLVIEAPDDVVLTCLEREEK